MLCDNCGEERSVHPAVNCDCPGVLMTQDEQLARQLRNSERNFRLLVEGITDYAIYMLDPQGRIANWNAGAERIKGYAVDEIVGQHFSIFYPPEDRASGMPAKALATAFREELSNLEARACQ